MVFAFAIPPNAEAFTVRGPKWNTTTVTYTNDSSFTSQGSGWAGRSDGAAQDWNNAPGPFTFSKYSLSGQHVQAQNLSGDPSCGGCLAITYSNSNCCGTMTSFNIIVNVGSGYSFYDGTQAPSLPRNYYDLRTVMRHEFGHGMGLCHSSVGGQLMHVGQAQGEIKVVDTDASNGARYLYESGYSGPGPSGGCSS
jgi:hypothetical protein